MIDGIFCISKKYTCEERPNHPTSLCSLLGQSPCKKMKIPPPIPTSRSIGLTHGILITSGFMLGALSSHAAVVASWETDGIMTSTQGGGVAPYTLPATFKDMNVSAANLTLSSSVLARSTPDGYGYVTPHANRAGNQGQALAKDNYVQFALTVPIGFQLGLTQISLNFQSDVPGGPKLANLYSDVDGFTKGKAIASATGGAGDLFPSTIVLGPAYQNLSQVTFRIYTWDSSGEVARGPFFAGTGSDIVIEGTVVPEISTSMSVCGMLAFFGFRRRRVMA